MEAGPSTSSQQQGPEHGQGDPRNKKPKPRLHKRPRHINKHQALLKLHHEPYHGQHVLLDSFKDLHELGEWADGIAKPHEEIKDAIRAGFERNESGTRVGVQPEIYRPIVTWAMGKAFQCLATPLHDNWEAAFHTCPPMGVCMRLGKAKCQANGLMWREKYVQAKVGKNVKGVAVWEYVHRLVLWAKEGAGDEQQQQLDPGPRVAMHVGYVFTDRHTGNERRVPCAQQGKCKCINPHHLRWGSKRENMVESILRHKRKGYY
jgi:hypothetical protein